MKNKTCLTWQAQIFCGLRVGYAEEILSIEKVYRICQEYVDEIGWCVTVTPTMFIYKNGHEPGVIIGIIQYPRFLSSHDVLRERTIELAKQLLTELKQLRVSIAFPKITIMLEKKNLNTLNFYQIGMSMVNQQALGEISK